MAYKEDPLERLDREERERKERNTDLRKVMYALIAVAALLAGALAYIWIQKSSLVKELEVEKEDLTEQIVALQSDYDNLSSDYDSINSQLDSSREEVAQLVERIKKTEATNRAQMRKYEKELGTLRSIMRNYITQIDSLNTLNHQLTADAAAARKEAAESRKANKELTQQVESLSGQVAAGSVIKARGIRLDPYNAADKVTDRSSRVVRMLTTLSLVENDLAPKGPVRVYIRVKDPEGILLTNGTQVSFAYQGSTMMASASREVDYEGKEVEMSIYLNDIPSYEKGIYTVEAYTTQSFLGSAEVLLR
jgi:outer membrane murein-binding lipoprotein Lpp